MLKWSMGMMIKRMDHDTEFNHKLDDDEGKEEKTKRPMRMRMKMKKEEEEKSNVL